MEKARLVLAMVLAVIVIFVYQIMYAPAPVKEEKSETAVTQSDSPAPSTAAAAPQTVPDAGALPVAAPGTEKDIIIDTPLYEAVFTTKGAALRSFKLKDFRTSLDPDSELVELVHTIPGNPLPFSLTFIDSTIPVALEGFYHTDSSSLTLNEADQPKELVFTQTHGGIRIEKIFTFDPAKYTIQLDVNVKNLSSSTIQQNAALTWFQYDDPFFNRKSGWWANFSGEAFSHDGPIHFATGSVLMTNLEKMKAMEHFGPNISWAGYESKYFIAAMIPQRPALTTLSIGRDDNHLVSVQMNGPKNLIPTNETGVFSYTLYMGPKDYSIMKALDLNLENAINFGSWLKWLAIPLLIALKFIFQYVGNYGIAIIILTILIKIIFWPLSNKSYKSMKSMRDLQPKMMEIREKYQDDKQRLNQEIWNLYKSNKVNPMAGCLPMLIQLPVFIGLYKVFLCAIELRHSPFFFWILDLSAKDPYYITPLIMGASTYIQFKMTPMTDPMQQKIMLFMPVVFTLIFLNFPSGLVIYWLFNNILSIAQQYYVNKKQ